jgi:hypothetical protein
MGFKRLKIQFVPRRKQSPSRFVENGQLMLYEGKIAVLLFIQNTCIYIYLWGKMWNVLILNLGILEVTAGI